MIAAVMLPPDEARTLALHILDAATSAEHDAAVLRARPESTSDPAQMLTALRVHRSQS